VKKHNLGGIALNAFAGQNVAGASIIDRNDNGIVIAAARGEEKADASACGVSSFTACKRKR